jgi:hypothetical protein
MRRRPIAFTTAEELGSVADKATSAGLDQQHRCKESARCPIEAKTIPRGAGFRRRQNGRRRMTKKDLARRERLAKGPN